MDKSQTFGTIIDGTLNRNPELPKYMKESSTSSKPQITFRDQVSQAFDPNLEKSPWNGGPCPGLRRDTKIWNPPETYLEWAAIQFPHERSLKAAHAAFQHTEKGYLCPTELLLDSLILPKEGYEYMRYLFEIVESPMDEGLPQSSTALYHRDCVHKDIIARLPSDKSNSPLARKLWFRTTRTGRSTEIKHSKLFLVAKILDEEIQRLLRDPTFDTIFHG
jgi:hypothetical protein